MDENWAHVQFQYSVILPGFHQYKEVFLQYKEVFLQYKGVFLNCKEVSFETCDLLIRNSLIAYHQGVQWHFFLISCPKCLKFFFNSDTIPDTRKAILKVHTRVTNLPTPHFTEFPNMTSNVDFKIMNTKSQKAFHTRNINLKSFAIRVRLHICNCSRDLRVWTYWICSISWCNRAIRNFIRQV